jgi:hypothetical protein
MALDGIYNVTIHTAIGVQKTKLVFKTEGNHLKGRSENPLAGTRQLENVKARGHDLTWSENTITPAGPLTLDFRCTIECRKLIGTATSMFGLSTVEGVRELKT